MRRHTFDVGEIEFVAENMDCMTREYVIAARRAAMARARRRSWPEGARQRMRRAADKMKVALNTWPPAKFDSRICPQDD